MKSFAAIGMGVLVFIFGVWASAQAQYSIIEVTPTEYDFGNVAIGDSATTTVTIQNTNGHILTITNIALSGIGDPDFSITSSPTLPAFLDWNGTSSAEVEITFGPQTIGYNKTTTLVIVSDDLENPVITVPLIGNAPGFECSPLQLDFGQVEVGEIAEQVITVTSLVGTHSIVSASIAENYDFYVKSVDTGDLLEGQSGDVVIGFAPTSVGNSFGEAAIIVINLGYTFVAVQLSGEGVDLEPDPEEQIAEIIDFIDTSVASGDLEGTGNGNSPENRLNALMNMIEAAGDLIEAGDIEGACGQLRAAYRKCDDEPRPPDFVEGEAQETLAQMILDLMESLGC